MRAHQDKSLDWKYEPYEPFLLLTPQEEAQKEQEYQRQLKAMTDRICIPERVIVRRSRVRNYRTITPLG